GVQYVLRPRQSLLEHVLIDPWALRSMEHPFLTKVVTGLRIWKANAASIAAHLRDHEAQEFFADAPNSTFTLAGKPGRCGRQKQSFDEIRARMGDEQSQMRPKSVSHQCGGSGAKLFDQRLRVACRDLERIT